ncbi:glycosyltransferase [Clostridium sp. HBUAS56017]|uniref:glycosyltransferase n=1 Tax=Clostridium sp. HBUAS56017 TaxID=2571128 RepID=UPI0011787B40|nr:glycosyltransferase [Clostridium sp. HBUAS56017]
MIENKNILFIANGGKEWIGGLYYVKNIIYTLIRNNKINNSTKIYILAKEENFSIFNSFLNYDNIEVIVYKDSSINAFLKKITNKIFHKSLDLVLYDNAKKFNVHYIYPVSVYPYLFLEDKCVYWIPDFQHIHLPEMFSKEEIEWRNKIYKNMAKKHKNLILSSKDAFNDYKSLYPNNVDGVNILSFESYIEDDLNGVDDDFIKNTLDKFNISNEFVFLPNQFWKHKNHITAFKAIDYVVNKKGKQVYMVCTGNTNDYRNKEHFNSLLNFIKNNKLENNIKILGFISRKEQLALMSASNVVIQPSLFEGWGTVVEDAKALDKKIIMSDINVHLEQKNEKCILFSREDYSELGDIIYNLL